MAEYLKKADVIKAMEDNSVVLNVYGRQRKMIDGLMLCGDIADMKTIEIGEHEEEDNG